MDNLERQLNKLPRKKLSKQTDLKIRTKLYFAMWQKKIIDFPVAFEWPRLQPVKVVASILLLLVIIVPGYAYASDKVTLGHVLYPVKTALEQAEFKLSQTPEEQVKTYEKFAGRRLAEANVLSQEGQKEEDNLVETVARAVNLTETAAAVAETLPSEAVETIVSRAQVEQVSTLTQVAQNVGINASEATVDNIALALDKVKKPHKKEKGELEPGWKGQLPSAVEKEELEAETKPEEEEVIDESLESSPEDMILPIVPPVEKVEPQDDDISTPRQSAGQAKQEIKEEPKEEKEAAKRTIEQTKKEIAELKAELPKQDYEQKDIESLFKRLDEKVEKAESAYKDKRVKDLNKILEAAGAVTNNATSFIKPKKEKKNDKDKGSSFLDRFRQRNESNDEDNNEDNGEQVNNHDKSGNDEYEQDNNSQSNRRINLRNNTRQTNN